MEPVSVLPGDSGDMEDEATKEWEHTLLQDSMDKELNELNRRLEQKEVRQTLALNGFVFWCNKLVFRCLVFGLLAVNCEYSYSSKKFNCEYSYSLKIFNCEYGI